MLGRKTYTHEELDRARTAIAAQLGAYRTLADGPDLAAFEPLLFNHLTLVLDRFFVHRLRMVAGKDSNPLNEVAVLAESLIEHDGVATVTPGIRLKPEQTVLGLRPGDEIRLSAADFEALSLAFLAEIETRFVTA